MTLSADEADGMEMHGATLRLLTTACPEQYDVLIGDARIGYLRLRHNRFTAEYPDVGGKLVYESAPKGCGEFEPAERFHCLSSAVVALVRRHEARKEVDHDPD